MNSAWILKKIRMNSERISKEFRKKSGFCRFLIKQFFLLILGADWAHQIFSKLLQTKPFLTTIKMQCMKSLLVIKVDPNSFSDESWVWIFLFIYAHTTKFYYPLLLFADAARKFEEETLFFWLSARKTH